MTDPKNALTDYLAEQIATELRRGDAETDVVLANYHYVRAQGIRLALGAAILANLGHGAYTDLACFTWADSIYPEMCSDWRSIDVTR